MDWSILGIAPTQDKKEITRAYRGRLTSVNPEDKPEEFKALRAAYEKALAMADREPVPEAEKSPVELWSDRLRALYNDFASRIDPEAWRSLLADDLLTGLDTRPLAEEALLRFLMDEYLLPQKIWQLLDGEFGFSRRAEELYETYPRDFIDYAVLEGIRSPEDPPLDLFIPGKNAADCEKLRSLYRQLQSGEAEDPDSLIAEAAQLSERHPYMDALICRLDIQKGSTQRINDLLAICDAYPDQCSLSVQAADLLISMNDPDRAEALCRRVLDRQPENRRATYHLACALAARENYEDAMDLLDNLFFSSNGNRRETHILEETRNKWSKALILQYEARLDTEPENAELRRDLFWAYFQSNRREDAEKIAADLKPGDLEPYSYLGIQYQLASAADRIEEALTCMNSQIELLRNMKPDGTKKTADRIRSLPNRLLVRGSLLIQLGRQEEAIAAFLEAGEAAPDSGETFTSLILAFLRMSRFDIALDAAEHLAKLVPNSYHSHYLLALPLFFLHRDREAFQAINQAINHDGSALEAYILKIRILIRNGAYDEAGNVLNFLQEHGAPEAPDVLWCRAMMAEDAEEDKEKAREMYEQLLKDLGDDTTDWLPELCYRLTGLRRELAKDQECSELPALLALLDKGLSKNPDDFSCLHYKAWLLKRDKQTEEAKEIYLRLEQIRPTHRGIQEDIAALYYTNLSKHAEEAGRRYRTLSEVDPENPEYLFYLGMCLLQQGRLEEAEVAFLAEKALEPDVLDAYHRLSSVYEAMGRLEDALEQINEVLKIVEPRDSDQSQYYLRKVQILRRLGRPAEAVEVLQYIAGRYGYAADQDIHDVYAQFGMWDNAKQHYHQWAKRNPSGANAARVLACICQNKLLAADLMLSDRSQVIGQSQAENLQLLLDKAHCKWKRALKVMNKKLEADQKKHASDIGLTYQRLALTEHWAGLEAEARAHAQAALESYEGKLALDTLYETLYRARRGLILALLGEGEAGLQELKRARSLPLCSSCPYGSCKDADLYEAYIAGILGETDAATVLAQEGIKKYPDEEDFVVFLHYLNRKERKR